MVFRKRKWWLNLTPTIYDNPNQNLIQEFNQRQRCDNNNLNPNPNLITGLNQFNGNTKSEQYFNCQLQCQQLLQ